MTNEHLNDDVVPGDIIYTGSPEDARAGATAAGSNDISGGSSPDLGDADLRDSGSGNTELTDTGLGDVDLRDADVRDADLRNADLGDADLDGANVEHTDASGRVAPEREANLSGLDDPGHVFDQTNGLVDGLQGETDEEAEDSTSRADRTGDGSPVIAPTD
jgi:hypothetical protein